MALTKGQRKLTKSKQDSAAVSSLIGTPAPNEGDNGDIQVRMTDRGPRLFAKLGNKWWITDLKDATTSRQEVKMHFFQGELNASTIDKIRTPGWINPNSVTGIIFFLNHSGTYWHIYNWADISDDDGTSAETGPYVTRHRVLFETLTGVIQIDRRGTQIDDAKQFKCIVFYI